MNQDGTLAVGSSHVYDGTTFGALGTLPISGSIKKLAPDDHTLYTYDTGSNRIYVLDVTAVTQVTHVLHSRVQRSVFAPRVRSMGVLDVTRVPQAPARRR